MCFWFRFDIKVPAGLGFWNVLFKFTYIFVQCMIRCNFNNKKLKSLSPSKNSYFYTITQCIQWKPNRNFNVNTSDRQSMIQDSVRATTSRTLCILTYYVYVLWLIYEPGPLKMYWFNFQIFRRFRYQLIHVQPITGIC